MILELLLDMLYGIFSLLTTPINIPAFPEEVSEMLSVIFDYIVTGIKICNVFIPMYYFGILFGIILAIDAGIAIYKFVMWVLKKIPMLGIS